MKDKISLAGGSFLNYRVSWVKGVIWFMQGYLITMDYQGVYNHVASTLEFPNVSLIFQIFCEVRGHLNFIVTCTFLSASVTGMCI